MERHTCMAVGAASTRSATIWVVSIALLPRLVSSTASLIVTPTSALRSGSWVHVSWKGIQNATGGDAVALFPANAADGVPLRFKWVSQYDDWREGSGTFTFQLLNHRTAVRFHYFRDVAQSLQAVLPPLLTVAPPNVFSFSKIVASSSIITMEQVDEPSHLHLALTNDASEMLVQWTSASSTTPVVRYGTQPDALTAVRMGNSSTYRASDMCGPPANTTAFFHPGHLHFVKLTDLEANTTYYFTVSTEGGNGTLSSTFTTGPPVGCNSSVAFFAWADSGLTTLDGSYLWDNLYGIRSTVPPKTPQGAFVAVFENQYFAQGQQGASTALVAAMQKHLPELGPAAVLLHQGDIAYAHGNTAEWDQYFEQYAAAFAHHPYMTIPGNHERDYPDSGDRFARDPNKDSAGECGIPYQHRLRMPQPSPEEQWYAFSYGPVRFIQLSTEQDWSEGSSQHRWLLQELTSINRSDLPWLVVGLHRPMYHTSLQGNTWSSDPGVAASLQQDLEELFLKHNVDMLWTGHIHLYQRTCPIFRRRCQGYNADGTARAPVHLVFGNGGYELWWLSNPKPPDYWEVVELEHGYILAWANGTHFRVQARSMEDPAEGILDDFTLTKPVGWLPNKAALQQVLSTSSTQRQSANWWDDGLSISTGNLIFGGALLALKEDVQLLQSMVDNNLTAVVDPLAAGSLQDLSEVLRPFWQLARQERLLRRAGVNMTQAQLYFDVILEPILQYMEQGISNWTGGG